MALNFKIMRFSLLLLSGCFFVLAARAQYGPDIAARAIFEQPSPWSIHFQLTAINIDRKSVV